MQGDTSRQLTLQLSFLFWIGVKPKQLLACCSPGEPDCLALAALCHAQSTRAARERILSMPRERSSWVAKPRTRVPMGCPFWFTSTQAFLWNLTTLPSLRCSSFRVSTITAFCTEPATTLPARGCQLQISVLLPVIRVLGADSVGRLGVRQDVVVPDHKRHAPSQKSPMLNLSQKAR